VDTIALKPGKFPKAPRLGERFRLPMRGGYKLKGPQKVADKRMYDLLHTAFLLGVVSTFMFDSGTFTVDGHVWSHADIESRFGVLDGFGDAIYEVAVRGRRGE
jgi:hypothetical protein